MPSDLPEAVDINNNKLNLHYYPGYLNDDRCEELIAHLEGITYDENVQTFMYGNWVPIPRKQATFGDAEVVQRGWEPFLQKLARELSDYVRSKGMLPADHEGINHVLVSYCQDGKSYIGWCADDESGLASSVIVSLSFGTPRDFIFRKKSAQDQEYGIQLSNGDMLIMLGDTQKHWQHALPERAPVTDPHWSLTFRIMWKN